MGTPYIRQWNVWVAAEAKLDGFFFISFAKRTSNSWPQNFFRGPKKIYPPPKLAVFRELLHFPRIEGPFPKFTSSDNLFFAQEIVWKPSVILLLCLSHLWKLLVPLSWPFFSIYNSNDKLEQRHLVCVLNKNHNAPTLTMLFIIIISFSQNWGTVPQFCEKAPPLKNGQFLWQKRPENAPNFFHGFLTYTKFTFCKKNGPNRPILSSAVFRIIYCRL